MSVATAHELKSLVTRRTQLNVEMKALKQQQSTIVQSITRVDNQLSNINQQIEQIERMQREVTVTEHALLRFIERIDKIDLEQLRKRVLPPNVEAMVKTAGAGTYPAGTHRIVVKNNTVVSVLEAS